MEADIRPVSAYADAIISESLSVFEIERVCRAFDEINSYKLSSCNILLPSKFIELIVGFSITLILSTLFLSAIVTVLK